ncbi:MAG: SIMPL domain-containing protein, partial [Egibacteraceae bacterium]
HDVDLAGELLAAVAEAAGDDARVEGLRFSLEDNEDQLAAAREDAFADARSKARHYAELADAELGELVSVTETSTQLPPPTPLPTDVAARAPERAQAPTLPGAQEVGAQIRATWSLQ